MSKYIICQSFKQFHRAVFSIAYPKYRVFLTPDGNTSFEDSNRYAHLFLIEREYFGFNTLECVVVE